MTLMRALALAGLLCGAAWADGARPDRRRGASGPTGDGFSWANDACPLDVSVGCRGYCPDRPAGQTCRWSGFPCEFKVCWANPRNKTIRSELQSLLQDPRSYVPEAARSYTGHSLALANMLSGVLLVETMMPEIRLVDGRFMVLMPQSAAGDQARRILRYAQRCSQAAMDQQGERIESLRSDGAQYWVQGCRDRVRLARIPEVAPAQARSGPSGGSGGATAQPGRTAGNAPSQVVPGPGVATLDAGGIAAMSTDELRSRLTENRDIRVTGRVITVNGYNPFAPVDDLDEMMAALDNLPEQDRMLLKPLRERMEQDALADARRDGPPAEGMTYFFNNATGEVEETPLVIEGNGKIPYPKEP
ncbi:MAG: hypothetical protein HY927_14625 [Elusimicrobia bacterium]|nr:hypothetical protein [Elusimicrobiota bacterium]